MNKTYLVLLTLISIFILLSAVKTSSLFSLFFLPVPAYFLTTLITNSDEFSFSKSQKLTFVYFGLVVIMILISLSKII